MVLMNPKFTAKDVGDSEITERMMNISKASPGAGRLKWIAAAGATIGLVKTANDSTDDNLLSTGLNMGVGAGVALGLDWGVNKLTTAGDIAKADVDEVPAAKRLGLTESELPEKSKGGGGLTTGDLGKEMPKVQHELSEEELRRVRKIKGWARNGKVASVIGLGVFALASAMDAGQDLSDKQDMGEMKMEQERNLTKKMNQQKRAQAQNAYGHVDMGEMVLDMFNDRIGHHQMGNAKFNQPTYNTYYQG